MAEEMGREAAELIFGERELFSKSLPDFMPGDPGHEDRYICHGCHRPMELYRMNPRVAFYAHRCELLDDKWVLLVKTSFVKDLYRRMIQGLIEEGDFGAEDKSE